METKFLWKNHFVFCEQTPHTANNLNNFVENVRADTAGSAKYVSEKKNKNKAAIASKLSAKIYNLDILKSNIEDEKGNVTRFLIMGKPVLQPELKKKKIYNFFII